MLLYFFFFVWAFVRFCVGAFVSGSFETGMEAEPGSGAGGTKRCFPEESGGSFDESWSEPVADLYPGDTSAAFLVYNY